MNTTAILAVAAIGFAVSAVSGYFLIPYLHKLHFGQTILDIGPSWHKNNRETVRSLSVVGAGDSRGPDSSTRGPGWTRR